MAFPTIPTAGANTLLSTATTAASTTHTFPSLTTLAASAGDLIIAICVQYSGTSGGSPNDQFSSWGASLTEFADHELTTADSLALGAAYKIATGSESGTFTVTSAGTFRSVNFLMRIPAATWQGTTPPEIVGSARGSLAATSAAALSPSWGAADTLWITVYGHSETTTTGSPPTIDADPTNYTGELIVPRNADAVGHITAGVSFRQVNASSEDAGTWTVTNPTRGNSIATTIAVRPAPATHQISADMPLGFSVVSDLYLPHFVDTFPGVALDARWEIQSGTPTVSGGNLTLEIDAVEGIRTPAAFTRNMTGCEFAWRNETFPGSTGAPFAYCSLYIDSTHYVSFIIYDTMIEAAKNTGTGFASLAQSALDTTNHRWMRIIESSGTTLWQVSPDGSTWSTLYSEANPISMTALNLSLETSPDGTAINDWVISDARYRPATATVTHLLSAAFDLGNNTVSALVRETFLSAVAPFGPLVDSSLVRTTFITADVPLGPGIVTNLDEPYALHLISADMPLGLQIDSALLRTTFLSAAAPFGPVIDSSLLRETYLSIPMALGNLTDSALLRQTFIAAEAPFGPQIDSNLIVTVGSTEHFIAAAFDLGWNADTNVTRVLLLSSVVPLGPQIDTSLFRTTFLSAATPLDLQIATALVRQTFISAATPLDLQIATNLLRVLLLQVEANFGPQIASAFTMNLFMSVPDDLGLLITSNLIKSTPGETVTGHTNRLLLGAG